jgi:2-polyprenyl-6-methoxyphenol hydroxylase-like FAD-dependent oxidoreductase
MSRFAASTNGLPKHSSWRRRRHAAHINNPLGGMGMNGGIHDAINLTARLADVWHGRSTASELGRYDRQRRLVTLEHIEQQSIQNKRNLESDGIEFGQTLRHIAADRARVYEYLLRVSMIASLRRAQELGYARPERRWRSTHRGRHEAMAAGAHPPRVDVRSRGRWIA